MVGKGGLGIGRWHFMHEMGWRDDDRAERRLVAVVQPLPIHRNAEKAGCAKSGDAGGDFFKMPARPFLTVIHAKNHLRRGRCGGGLAGVIGRQRDK